MEDKKLEENLTSVILRAAEPGVISEYYENDNKQPHEKVERLIRGLLAPEELMVAHHRQKELFMKQSKKT